MKIRRYVGSNTQEAILKVKMDLGNDAVILNTRKVRQKGLFKLFAKPMIEILAAVDDESAAKSSHIGETAAKKERVLQKQDEKLHTALRDINVKSDQFGKTDQIIQLENKVNNMEAVLNKIYDVVNLQGKKDETTETNKPQSQKQQLIKHVYNNLVKNDVDAELAKKIVNLADEKTREGVGLNEISSEVYQTISTMLGRPQPIRLRTDGKPTVVLFLGPTGVGKTTTLAKLAADYALSNKKEVGLITADTYRIAAVDQLRTYAEIIGLPISVIYSVGEIKGAIEEYKDKDLILIDTAGTSYNNKSQFEELKELVEETTADEIFLVISATISMRNCKDIMNNYQFLKEYKLIFTKIDETSVNGIILNTRYSTGKNLSYITTGQSVPDDIEIANIDTITKKLLGA